MHTRVSDNRERLLREVAKRARRPHIPAPFSLANDFTLIDCYDKDEFLWYITYSRLDVYYRHVLVAGDLRAKNSVEGLQSGASASA
jgi:hypothetical protein